HRCPIASSRSTTRGVGIASSRWTLCAGAWPAPGVSWSCPALTMSVAGKRRGRRSSTNSSDRCPTNDEPSRLRLEGNSETRRHRGGRTVVVAEQLTHVHEHRLAARKDEHAADPDVKEVAIGLVGLEEESRSRRRIHEGEAHRALVVHELVYVFRGGLR